MTYCAEDVRDFLTSDFQRPTRPPQTQWEEPLPSSSTEIHKQRESPRVPLIPPELTTHWRKSFWVSEPKLSGSEESVLSQDQVCSLTSSVTESKTDLSLSSFLQRDCEYQLGGLSPVLDQFCQQTQLSTPCSIFSESRPSNYPSDDTQLLTKLEALQLHQTAQAGQLQLCDGNNEAGDVDISSLDDLSWETSESFKDFTEDPAHQFWKWDETLQQWSHQDEDTKSVIYCPVELD
ncbi:hypothetical protein BDP55DRAFT_654417 [Colletotrichum godetiae]|uniref:Uncharacterized protein n=1 Tax=Colletotrichum godetiae TaxID=1209918 RepID=A0AAJ0EWU7_9PEZI|nr:uncharacterized protein BDP55DRAFT_654417 [Colletotrichum godetiae]KAK1689155.1 hypothetical protein BDP55DRAFT_654417 [Colletotrichum godetiae]